MIRLMFGKKEASTGNVPQATCFQFRGIPSCLSILIVFQLWLANPPPSMANPSIAAETTSTSLSEQLPMLGDPISALSSPEQEHLLGRAWLRSLRRQANLINDPLLVDYVENLIYRLASYSNIDSPDIELAVINSEMINAFAVPGGIIGINAGLLLHAESEAELASVIAHELAHLSQRHYARNSEYARRNQLTHLATLLASIALMATTGGESGIATLATSLALSQQNQLRYSRDNEREADRIGMQTLARAGIDPFAMPRFFEKLHIQTRFLGELPPEFLLTHPVTQSRISDSRLRAAKYRDSNRSATSSIEQLEFALMRARVLAAYRNDPIENIEQFRAELKKESNLERKETPSSKVGSADSASPNPDASQSTTPEIVAGKQAEKETASMKFVQSDFQAQLESENQIAQIANYYGLVRALLKANRFEEAKKTLAPLRKKFPSRITFVISEAEILMAQHRYKEAVPLLKTHLDLNPKNYPLSIYYAQNLLRVGKPEKAIPILEEQLITKEENIYLWRLLSEAHGADGNTIGVHIARAEVFFLRNQTNQAMQQLKYALTLSKSNFQLHSRIQQRMSEIHHYRKKWKMN